jgi:hypothetical protein
VEVHGLDPPTPPRTVDVDATLTLVAYNFTDCFTIEVQIKTILKFDINIWHNFFFHKLYILKSPGGKGHAQFLLLPAPIGDHESKLAIHILNL